MRNINKKLLLLNIALLACGFSFSQIITTVAGNGNYGYYGDGGMATAAKLSNPIKVCSDSGTGFLIADYYNNVIRRVSSTGIITTCAGTATPGYSGDGGMATNAELNDPVGVCRDTSGNIYISDYKNNVVRKVSVLGIITTIAGNGSPGFSGDGSQATSAELNGPDGLCIDKIGNIYISDIMNNRVRKVAPSGIITTIAGDGTFTYSGDGGPATSAGLEDPTDVCIDKSGNIFINDANNVVIRKVSAAGIITTVAGNNTNGYSGDGGMATNAELDEPDGVCVDASGNIYIGDYGNNRVRKVSTTGIISTVAGNRIAGYSGDNGPATAAKLSSPTGVCINGSGDLLIADYGNSVIRKVSSPWLAGEKELQINSEEITLYPNPNNGVFQLGIRNLELRGDGIVEIYNIIGEKIYSKQLSIVNGGALTSSPNNNATSNCPLSIDISSNPAGIYLYRVLSANNELIGQGKFIKE